MPLTRDELNASLWSAADILRGLIDSADYKLYLFGFLFLKRLSDAFDQEAERILRTHRSEGQSEEAAIRHAWEDPDQHAFFVPRSARWIGMANWNRDIGRKLNRASRDLERHNPILRDALASIDFDDARRLGERAQRDATLKRLITHFSALNLRNDNLTEPDALGGAYEYLIERFADDAGKKGGEFYTPREVANLLVRLIKPREGMSIYDPTAGSGGMLIACARHIQDAGGNERHTTLCGQEKNVGAWAICRLNLLLHGLPDADIRRGDVLRDPKHTSDGELMTFDRVIANPPFSLKNWGRDDCSADPFRRFSPEIAPRAKGDFAFLQHMLASTNERGVIGAVLPNGMLFRGGVEARIRRDLIERDLFEAVIGLPANLFFGTAIPACIVTLNRAKTKARRGRILFIDAESDEETRAPRRRLDELSIQRIAETFDSFGSNEGKSRAVTLEEVRENGHNLNLARYLAPERDPASIDLKQASERLIRLQVERDAAERELNKELKALGLL